MIIVAESGSNKMSAWLMALVGMLTGSLLVAMTLGSAGQAGRNLPDYLATLKNAPQFDDSAVGAAAQRSDTFKAFAKAYAAGSALREDLEWLLRHASPAGRLYAALVLGKIDKNAGTKALESLKQDSDTVEYRSGSLLATRTVGELASDMLRGEAVIILPPSMQ
jgi:hypothetical protein